MEDLEVVVAFVAEGSRRCFGPSLHVEGDALFLDGWWHTAFRVSPTTFIVRNEAPPTDTSALADVTAALAGRGLRHVGVDLPPITAITYTELALGSVSWNLWAHDLASGERDLMARAGYDAFLGDVSLGLVDPAAASIGAELGGARRLAGLPASLILAVGVHDTQVRRLQAELGDCRFETKGLGELDPEDCGVLLPTLVLVDCTGRPGQEFVMQLRASACGRFIPVVAVTGGDTPPGADARVEPGDDTGGWAEPIRRLLP